MMEMLKEGNLLGSGLKFGIVAARFNEFITSKLLGGAYDALSRHAQHPFLTEAQGQNVSRKIDKCWKDDYNKPSLWGPVLL